MTGSLKENMETNALTPQVIYDKIKLDKKEWEESHDYWNGGGPCREAPYGWDVNVIGETFGTREKEYKAIVTACKLEDGEPMIGDRVILEFMLDEQGLADSPHS